MVTAEVKTIPKTQIQPVAVLRIGANHLPLDTGRGSWEPRAISL
jgi:hypothetical protein